MNAEQRWIRLSGAVNVRDLGDLPTDEGGRTVRSRLLRADNLQGLTPADVRRLVDDFAVRLVLDLRTGVEVRSEGPGPLLAESAVEHRHFSLFPEAGHTTDVVADEVLPWTTGATGTVDTAGTTGTAGATPPIREPARHSAGPDVVAGYYLGYLRDRPDNVVAALRSIADEDRGAALVHCAAGKDRTGVVVALALSVAGVDRAAIIDDYVATGEVLAAVMGRLAASPTYAEDVAGRSLDSHRPVAQTMERFFEALDRTYGGAAGWLSAHGFDGAAQEALRRRLTA